MARTIPNRRKGMRLQSAVEYLTVYSWSILMISLVASSLFALGTFNGADLLGTSCVASVGFLCQNPTLNTNGQISFSFGQATSQSLYNVEVACASNVNSQGMPLSGTFTAVPGGTLSSGNPAQVSDLQCYNAEGQQYGTGSMPIGTTFNGHVWVEYTASPGAVSPQNPVEVSSIATVVAQSS